MESNAIPPQNMSSDRQTSQNWRRWRKEFESYMKITKGYEKPEDEQVAWLKNFIGPVGMDAFEKISFDDPADEENMTIVLQKLETFFDPPKNEVEERQRFFSRSKKNNESIDEYIQDLMELSKFCNFGDLSESLVRDVVVFDTKDKFLRKFLLNEENVNLEDLKIIYKTYQINSEKMKEVSEEVMAGSEKKAVEAPSTKTKINSKLQRCRKCKQQHRYGNCPAWKNVCDYCKQLNHYSHCCPQLNKEEITCVPNSSNSKKRTIFNDPTLKGFNFVEAGNSQDVQNKSSLSNSDFKKQPSIPPQANPRYSKMKPSAPTVFTTDLRSERQHHPPSYNSLYPDSSATYVTHASYKIQGTPSYHNQRKNNPGRRGKSKDQSEQDCTIL